MLKSVNTHNLEQKVIVGLDIGTTKICAIAAKVGLGGSTEIIGIGTAESNGLRKGVITNINAAVKSIKESISACELKSGVKIDTVFAGIAGHHIRGINQEGIVAVRGQSIEAADVERVVDSARAFNSPDKETLHILSQEYIVDGQDGVKDPIGMAGKRLQAKVHIVLGSITSATNIVQSCNQAGLNVAKIVLEPLASSFAVLHPDEKELGVILLDIGGGTTDLVIYKNECVVHSSVLPIGGNHVTKDIAVGLRTPWSEALKLKHAHGVAIQSLVKEGEVISVSGMQDRPDRAVDRQILAEIIEARFREIFILVKQEIIQNNINPMNTSGIVLTGGSSMMRSLSSLSEEIFEMPVRIGYPVNVQGLKELTNSPIYATAVGLIKYGEENFSEIVFHKDLNKDHLHDKVKNNLVDFLKKFF